MKNKIIAIILTGMILFLSADISSAATLDIYTTMEGTTEVSAPEFYIGSLIDEELLINEKSSDCDSFAIATVYRTFQTKDLNGTDFKYVPKVEFSFRAKGITSVSQGFEVSFGYYDASNPGVPIYLCSQTVNLTQNMENYVLGPVDCLYAPQNVDKLFYEFKKECPNCEYEIDKCEGDFYTKIKLSK